MQPVTMAQIEEKLKELPPHKLAVVYDFVSYLVERQKQSGSPPALPASERPRRCDWGEAEPDPEGAELAEQGMSEYLANLEEYEERLARGEIRS